MKRGWKGREGKESLPNVNFLVTSLAAIFSLLLFYVFIGCSMIHVGLLTFYVPLLL